MKPYKIGQCVICHQGILEIVKEGDSGTLFIYCDECEGEWENPTNALRNIAGSRDKYSSVIDPSIDEIRSLGWHRYLNP